MGKKNFDINVYFIFLYWTYAYLVVPKLAILVAMVSEVELVLLLHSTLKIFYFGLRGNQDKCLNQENYSIHEICPVTRKPVFWVCNQVRLKPACAATGSNTEISRPCWLVCWSVPLLVSSNKLRFSRYKVQMI